VAIPDNNNFYIGKNLYPLEELGEKIKTLMKDKTPEKRIVYIKCSIEVEYGTVVKAVDQIRRQDIDKIGLVADKKKKQQQGQ